LTEILRETISYGIFASLFCILLYILIKDSSKREQKYQNVIEKLTSRLREIGELKQVADTTYTLLDETNKCIEQTYKCVEKTHKCIEDIKQKVTKATKATKTITRGKTTKTT